MTLRMFVGFAGGDKWAFSCSQLDLPYLFLFSYQMHQVLKESQTKAITLYNLMVRPYCRRQLMSYVLLMTLNMKKKSS